MSLVVAWDAPHGGGSEGWAGGSGRPLEAREDPAPGVEPACPGGPAGGGIIVVE